MLLLLLSFLLWCSDIDERIHAPVLHDASEYTHPYSMMHRRLLTAGTEVAPHYHQLLVLMPKPSLNFRTGWSVGEHAFA